MNVASHGTIHSFNQVMCENSIDQKEGACLECDHDEDAGSPGNSYMHNLIAQH